MAVTPPTITERLVKQEPLTAAQMDDNLTNLKAYTTDVETTYSDGTGVVKGTCLTDSTVTLGAINPTGSTAGQVVVSQGNASDPIWAAAFSMPIGSIVQFGAASAPSGWLLCNGSHHDSTGSYSDLYDVIAYLYGQTDSGGSASGSGTYFKVPDMRGRMAIGSGTGDYDGTPTAYSEGDKGGVEEHSLTEDQMPNHRHSLGDASTFNISLNDRAGTVLSPKWEGYTNFTKYSEYTGSGSTSADADGTAHENMSPFVVINFIIKT